MLKNVGTWVSISSNYGKHLWREQSSLLTVHVIYSQNLKSQLHFLPIIETIFCPNLSASLLETIGFWTPKRASFAVVRESNSSTAEAWQNTEMIGLSALTAMIW